MQKFELKEAPVSGLWEFTDVRAAYGHARICISSDVVILDVFRLCTFGSFLGNLAVINARDLMPLAASAYRVDFVALR